LGKASGKGVMYHVFDNGSLLTCFVILLAYFEKIKSSAIEPYDIGFEEQVKHIV